MHRVEPHLPLSYGVPRGDERRIVSGIIFVIRYDMRERLTVRPRRSATTSSAGARWGDNRIFAELAAEGGVDDRCHAYESTPNGDQAAQKGLFPDVLGVPKRA